MATGISLHRKDVVIVGSGIGGLVCALSMAPKAVTVITKTPRLAGGSSFWAKGGIAAPIGPGDSPEAHAADTLAAGAGLSDSRRARRLTREAAAALQWLVDEGIPFDRDLDGTLALGQEAAHRHPRIVHAGGDTTGYVLMRSLIERVGRARSIEVSDDTFVYDLVVEDGRVRGVLAFSDRSGWVLYQAPAVVLATGGIGMVWQQTTNPLEATGDGLAMAARAGARLADLEFVQFHPTALAAASAVRGASLPLLTEALRGAGAILVDEDGRRFMPAVHPAAELAPRDVVARAIQGQLRHGHRVFLDLRPVLVSKHAGSFPGAMAMARRAGIDPFVEPLPVRPAAHYHMGGIKVGQRGRTSIAGLWACGEVAATGIHGANRLASNSLLEALVYARRVADELSAHQVRAAEVRRPPAPLLPPSGKGAQIQRAVSSTRSIMSQAVGIARDRDHLESAVSRLAALERELMALATDAGEREPAGSRMVREFGEARNIVLVARLVTFAALRRRESRGAHFRSDYPEPRAKWRHPRSLTLANIATKSRTASLE